MSLEIPTTNAEAESLAAADNAQAQRIVALWTVPIAADSDIPEMVRIPPALWATLKAAGDCPEMFSIGRREFTLTSNLRRWLDDKSKATGAPGNRRLRKQKSA